VVWGAWIRVRQHGVQMHDAQYTHSASHTRKRGVHQMTTRHFSTYSGMARAAMGRPEAQQWWCCMCVLHLHHTAKRPVSHFAMHASPPHATHLPRCVSSWVTRQRRLGACALNTACASLHHSFPIAQPVARTTHHIFFRATGLIRSDNEVLYVFMVY
jgi:hypothetical protein